MAVAPLIAMKSTACDSLAAVGAELDRRAHTYVNDVDQSRSHLNLNYRVRPEDARPLPLDEAVERRISELNTKRKIRDNQVRAMGFVVSTNGALDDETARKFLAETVDYFCWKYGRENFLAASEHYDEGVPHVHLWIAPVIHDEETGYDRLCAKELFAPDKTRKNPQTGKREVVSKGTMSRLQEDFWRDVASRYGFERPLPKELRQKGYRSLEAYKQHEGTTRELKAEITALRAERDGLEGDIAKKGAQLLDMEAELDASVLRRGEALAAEREAAERLESVRRDVAKVESIAQAGVFELGKLAKGGDDGAREREAVGHNQQLGGRVEQLEREVREARGRTERLERDVEGLGGRVREARGRRERLDERVRGLRGRADDLWGRLVDEAWYLADRVFEFVGRCKWVFDRLGIEAHEGAAMDATVDLRSMEETTRAASEAMDSGVQPARRRRGRSR